jgi:hypothetical protein
MVYRVAVAGLNVNRPHEHIFVEAGRDDKVAVLIVACGTDFVLDGHLEYDVRLAQRPAVAELAGRG